MFLVAGDTNPLSPLNVAVVSPMPHMTKSRSVTETQAETGKENTAGPGEDPLRGEISVVMVSSSSNIVTKSLQTSIHSEATEINSRVKI